MMTRFIPILFCVLLAPALVTAQKPKPKKTFEPTVQQPTKTVPAKPTVAVPAKPAAPADATVNLVWKGSGAVSIYLNTILFEINGGETQQKEVYAKRNYTLKVQKPAGTYAYEYFVQFEKGYNTLEVDLNGQAVSINLNKPVQQTRTSEQTTSQRQPTRGLSSFTENVNGAAIAMVAVKGGTFQMGSNDGYDDEKPVHTVTVSDFLIGKTEVTQGQWEVVMGSKPSRFKGKNLPVETVSWDDVQDFIRKLNRLTDKTYRLPTEAEWEYCAGSCAGQKFAGTSSESSLGSYAWYYDNSNSTTHAVGTKQPNELGLYDMSGNVWEWCNDWYGSYSSESQTNPQGPSSGSARVGRGGGWCDNASYCRVAIRGGAAPGYHIINLGFRLALVP